MTVALIIVYGIGFIATTWGVWRLINVDPIDLDDWAEVFMVVLLSVSIAAFWPAFLLAGAIALPLGYVVGRTVGLLVKTIQRRSWR
jgi:hypothetical protein